MQAVRLCHITPPSPSPSFTVHEKQESEKGDDDEEKQKVKRDPLRMFGILTPQSLRTAQKEAIEMVEGIIPRLVSIDVQMKEVEIQVRRARKFRGKAEGVEMEVKEKEEGLKGGREVLVE
jgi:hypothetical protein